MSATTRAANRLIHEKSPYLLQHAHNPVDWYPWGEEAFDRARREGKMILVSVGYSTCHWCHVMAHESFEDEQVGAALFTDYIAIKVDREERPDIDHLYMEICTRLTGQGGWPLNVLLTPERLPFFAGTYLPRHNRGGRIGLLELLEKASELWKNEPEKLRETGQALLSSLGRPEEGGGAQAGPELLEQAYAQLHQSFDPLRGGFGAAPKFPRPQDLRFLIQRHRATGDPGPLLMAEKTLTAIACGGIHDHLGGGIHRYSTDAAWLLPHFEKMLYDQAGIALAALEAWQQTGKSEYAEFARATLDYAARDLKDEQGGFHCGQDADSEGVEGKYYVWDYEEILEVLGREQGEAFAALYNAGAEGNFTPEVPGEEAGGNILHLERPLPKELFEQTRSSRKRLLERRYKRTAPHKDDKVLCSWSGYMISAFATGAALLGDATYLETAKKAADFLWTRLRTPQGRLLRRWREGEAGIEAFSVDYAFFAQGLLDLYRADFDPQHLQRAALLAGELVEYFMDEKNGRLFDTAKGAEDLGVRPRTTFDGALPSPNAVALGVLARIHRLTGEPLWEQAARVQLAGLAKEVARYPAGYCALLQSAALLLEPASELVITGGMEDAATKELLAAARRHCPPETSLLLRTPRTAPSLDELAPYTKEMDAAEPAARLCENGACKLPMKDAQELQKALC